MTRVYYRTMTRIEIKVELKEIVPKGIVKQMLDTAGEMKSPELTESKARLIRTAERLQATLDRNASMMVPNKL